MRTKFWIIGSFVAALCLFTACGDDNEDEKVKSIKSIVVNPATVSPLEVGGTAELTAVITPTNATEAIKWVSEDPAIVSVTENGAKATITAIKPGTTNVFATNQAGIIASNKIAVTVNEVDYAGSMIGAYSGTGSVTSNIGINQDLDDVLITVEKEGNEKEKVNLTLIASVNMGTGSMPLPIEAKKVELSPGTGDKLTISGKTEPLQALAGLWFTITGEFDPATKTLSLELVDDGPAAAKIVLEATAN